MRPSRYGQMPYRLLHGRTTMTDHLVEQSMTIAGPNSDDLAVSISSAQAMLGSATPGPMKAYWQSELSQLKRRRELVLAEEGV
jgi:hypothetical protein